MSATGHRMRVSCPGCGAVRLVSPRMVGLAVVCRSCGRPVRVLAPPDEERTVVRPLTESGR